MQAQRQAYIDITDLLGIPRNEKKDHDGCIAEVLGIEVDTDLFEARLLEKKLLKAISSVQKALTRRHLACMKSRSSEGSFLLALVLSA